jgi:hypothetical protein
MFVQGKPLLAGEMAKDPHVPEGTRCCDEFAIILRAVDTEEHKYVR